MHWTYSRDCNEPAHLMQGDIVEVTDDVRQLLHDRSQDESEWLALLVITQSCDLVAGRRGDLCKATRIALSPVRPLSRVVLDLLDEECSLIDGRHGIYSKKDVGKAEMMFSRIFNQNEEHLGVFYLHTDLDAGISEPGVADLRQKIIVSRRSYECIRQARVGRLTGEFQNRLGWLVGHMYSRVGTVDWDKDAVKSMTKDYLKGESSQPRWVNMNKLRGLRHQLGDLSGMSDEEFLKAVESSDPRTEIDEAIDVVAATTRSVLTGRGVGGVDEIINDLKNHLALEGSFRTVLHRDS